MRTPKIIRAIICAGLLGLLAVGTAASTVLEDIKKTRYPDRRREGGLQTVRLPRPVRRHHRPRTRLGGRRRVVVAFISLFRNTPPLVQIYFFYFGLGYLLPRVTDASGAAVPMVSNLQWAIISLLRCRSWPIPRKIVRDAIVSIAQGAVGRRQGAWAHAPACTCDVSAIISSTAEGSRPELLAPLYAFVLVCFFIYCYPIGKWTQALERKYRIF